MTLKLGSAALAVAALLVVSTGTLSRAEESKDSPGSAPAATFQASLQAAQRSAIALEVEGFGGELKLKSIVAPGTVVKTGEAVATVVAPDAAQEKADAEASARAAQASLDWWSHVNANELARLSQNLEREKLEFDAAKVAYEHFTSVGKQDRIKNAELSIQGHRDSIQDQEEELRQLEALYKGNDLAKESQDIVLNRSRRRLEQSRIRLKMALNDNERYLKFDLPREEAFLKLGLDQARMEFEAAKVRAEARLCESTGGLQRARQEAAAAKRREQRASKLQPEWVLTAPHGGVVIHAGEQGSDGMTAVFSAGQKLAGNATLAWVLDTSSLRCTVWLTAAQSGAAQAQKNLFSVTLPELSLTREARVVTQGAIYRDGKLAVTIEVDNKDALLLHGQPCVVNLGARR